MWSWGSDGYGRLGLGTEDRHQASPQLLVNLRSAKIASVAVGAAHSLLVDGQSEEVPVCYSWGKCHYGQLGHGELDVDEHVPRPIKALSGVKVASVGAGDSHSLAITTSGRVYSWGMGFYGCLGHGSETSLAVPCLIEALEGVVIRSAVGGASHTLAVAANGDLYAWGRDHMGQLGLPPFSIPKDKKQIRLNQRLPLKIVLPRPVKMVSACSSHSLILLTDGSMLMLGEAPNQVGGDCDDVMSCALPSEHFGCLPVVGVASGTKHWAAISSTGEVYCWGSGKYGRLGNGSCIDCARPKRVPLNDKIFQVSCGESHTMALSDKGEVWSWGSGHYGKLGTDCPGQWNELPQKVPITSPVNMVLCGTNHTSACILEK